VVAARHGALEPGGAVAARVQAERGDVRAGADRRAEDAVRVRCPQVQLRRVQAARVLDGDGRDAAIDYPLSFIGSRGIQK